MHDTGCGRVHTEQGLREDLFLGTKPPHSGFFRLLEGAHSNALCTRSPGTPCEGPGPQGGIRSYWPSSPSLTALGLSVCISKTAARLASRHSNGGRTRCE